MDIQVIGPPSDLTTNSISQRLATVDAIMAPKVEGPFILRPQSFDLPLVYSGEAWTATSNKPSKEVRKKAKERKRLAKLRRKQGR